MIVYAGGRMRRAFKFVLFEMIDMLKARCLG